MDPTYLTLGAFLIGIGLLLLLGELFVTSGVMLMLAVSSIIVGLVFLFKYDTTVGLCSTVVVMVAIPTLGIMLIRLLPNMPLSQLTRQPPEEPAVAIPHHHELQTLKGRVGKTLTSLHPAGMVEFDGRRIDSLTEGMMVEPGRWVRCVDVRGGAVIVRPVPESLDLDTAIFNDGD
jgi:membrane-bound serine protease (ClpP class)